jgi:NAD(P)H-quinone oxidoreductase subunit 6
VNIALLVFGLLGAAMLVSALGVVLSQSVVYSALFLLATLIAVAGFYIFLLAEFLALVQVLLYGGAVIVIIFFALMLTRQEEGPLQLDNQQRPWAAALALGLFFLYAAAVVTTPWPVGPPERLALAQLGEPLFRDWVLPFEVASLVLLVALLGAIVIARARD